MVTRAGRPAGLNAGLTGVGYRSRADNVHLPDGARPATFFMPETRPLDTILRRETLDERLARDVVPATIGPELMEPPMLSATRVALLDRLVAAAGQTHGHARHDVLAGIALLEEEVALDEEIREAIGALLRG